MHGLAAGKLTALLARRSARDLFDSRLVFSIEDLDIGKLRTAFVVYGAMARKDWRTVSAADAEFEPKELSNQLVPALRLDSIRGLDPISYGRELVEECRAGLSKLLPSNESEQAFLDLLLEEGEIDATILTSDSELQKRIQDQPLLEWKAQHVRSHKRR